MPVPENDALAPFTKLVPVTMTSIVVPRCPLVGETDVAVGAGKRTSKHPTHVSDWASGFVTVTSRELTVADGEIVMLTVMWLESVNVVEFFVMPVPLNVTVAPL